MKEMLKVKSGVWLVKRILGRKRIVKQMLKAILTAAPGSLEPKKGARTTIGTMRINPKKK
jgi:hypothetical protein